MHDLRKLSRWQMLTFYEQITEDSLGTVSIKD